MASTTDVAAPSARRPNSPVWSWMRRNPTIVFGVAILLLLVALAVLAPGSPRIRSPSSRPTG